MKYLSIKEVDIKNKRVLIRVDFNVPIIDGKIESFVRIESSLKTIKYALKKNAAVILMSHLGRPIEGCFNAKFSLEKISLYLSKYLNHTVIFKKNYLEKFNISPGQIVLCENVRFNKGEKISDNLLSKKLSKLGDVFVMDAFASSHRIHASTYGIMKHSKIVCFGMLFVKEINSLNKIIYKKSRKLTAIIGGCKINTKINMLKNIINKVDNLLLGGEISTIFLSLNNKNIRKNFNKNMILLFGKVQRLIDYAKHKNINIVLPIDVRVSKSFKKKSLSETKKIKDVSVTDKILDIGPETEKIFYKYILDSDSILWNGALGVFEFDNFFKGTKSIVKNISRSKSFSVAGGGDTISAIQKFGSLKDISYISTAGGAFLKFFETNGQFPFCDIFKKLK